MSGDLEQGWERDRERRLAPRPRRDRRERRRRRSFIRRFVTWDFCKLAYRVVDVEDDAVVITNDGVNRYRVYKGQNPRLVELPAPITDDAVRLRDVNHILREYIFT